MIEYINSHLSGFWVAVGFLLLVLEALIFGFSTIVFLFAGIGALVTGLLMMGGILPETWVAGISAFGIATGAASAALWKPLRALQERGGEDTRPQSDLQGLEFRIEQPLRRGRPGSYRYSGIDWKLELDDRCGEDEIPAGSKVRVVSVAVGRFRVCPAE